MKITIPILMLAASGILPLEFAVQTESLPPLKDGKSPQTLDEVWAGYDPTVEPIETEVCKEWEEDGTILRAVRYCIGTFKGSWMGALYGFPKGEEQLPAIVQIHGGGGSASKVACIANARRGAKSWPSRNSLMRESQLIEVCESGI